jgi:DNA-binding response OmpR family regulator
MSKETKETYVVRDNLYVRLTDSKTYSPGEKIDLTQAEYELHAHQLETEAQFLARTQPTKK